MGVPASRATSVRRTTPKSAAARPLATVLLVDDRSYDRAPIVDALTAERIAAPTLPSAIRALALLERAVEHIDAVLVSTAMPGCVAFARDAASLRPDLRFVVLGLSASRTSSVLEHLDRIGRPCRVVWPDADAEAVVREVVALLGMGRQSGREAA